MTTMRGTTRVKVCAISMLVTAAACGGGATADKPATTSGIPSMPATASARPAEAKAPEPAKPTDPASICAGAPAIDVKLADSARKSSAGEKSERVALSAAKAKDKSYTWADLQALEKKSAWEELLGHAEDVSPSQRNAAWSALIEKAATGYLGTLSTKTASFEGMWTAQAFVQRYPELTKSTAFMAKRDEVAKTAFEQCLQEAYRGQHCIDGMTDFLKTANTSAEVGFEFGKIVRRHQNHYVAVPFFKWAFDQKKNAAWCADEDLKMALIAGLGLPPGYEGASGARQIAATVCWGAPLRESLTASLRESQTGYARDNICAVLKAKGAL